MATCRLCGVELHFAPNQRGTLTPFTRDGVNHFIDCPYRRRFRKQEITQPELPLDPREDATPAEA